MEVKILERVEDIAIIQMPIDGFEKLSLNNKLLIFHLWHAGIAGDSIVFEQAYAHGLQLRDFFMDLLEYKEAIPIEIYNKIETYTKKIVIHAGNHNRDSTSKFIPSFSKKEMLETIAIAKSKGFPGLLSPEMEKIIFDQTFEVMLTQKSPPAGEDILTASHNTFYHNVKLSDIEGFNEKNPLNSNLVKESGKLVEKVWRTGNDKVPQGLYARQLKQVIKHMDEAIKIAEPAQKKALELLKQFFIEGDEKLFDEYNIEWVHSNPEVDTILGFIESYLDARGCKATFESMLFFKDHPTNHVIHTVADNAQYFEDKSPWLQKYKKKWSKVPVANAIMLVVGAGYGGPFCPAGVNLPNPQWIRDKHGSKNIYISNITYAGRNAYAIESWNEFLEKPEDIRLMSNSFNVRGPVSITFHEVVGHGSGTVSEKLTTDPKDYLREYYSSLEEARAELCALHHVWDPKVIELGLIKSEDEAKAAYIGYVFQYLTLYRRFGGATEIHEDHERATSLIVQYCIDKGSAGFYKKNGKTYPEVINYGLMRKHIAELLAEIMRIKAEGDYEAGKNLVNKYGVHFDITLRDEIVARSKAIGYPSRCAYVMPHPELVRDSSGKIIDVKVVNYNSVLDQARGWRKAANS